MVGVYVNPFEKVEVDTIKHSLSVLERVFKIMTSKESLAKFKHCDIITSPKGLNKYSTFALKDVAIIFNLGYETTIVALENDKRLEQAAIKKSELEAMNGFGLETEEDVGK